MEPVDVRLNGFSNVESKYSHLTNLLYSGVYCGIAFVFLHYFGYVISCINAHYLGFEPTVNYEGLSSLRHTTGWGPKSIAFVYLAPAAFGFLVFLASAFLCFKLPPPKTHFRNIMFWIAFNAYLLFYSYFFIGIVGVEYRLSDFYASYASVFDWLYWSPETSKVVLGFFALISLVGGFVFSPLILSFNHSQSLVGVRGGDRVVFTNVVLIPLTIGIALLLLATFPMDIKFHAVQILSVIPLLVVSWLGMKLVTEGSIMIVKGGLDKQPLWKVVVMALVLVFIGQFVLGVPVF